MNERQQIEQYAQSLVRVSGRWGDWEACSQLRRPLPQRYEVRRSVPLAMLAAVALAALAIDSWLLGLLLDNRTPLVGVWLAVAAVVLFPLGHGVEVDGEHRQVTQWWGFVPRPLLRRRMPFDRFQAVEIGKQLGGVAAEANVGRTVRRPVTLVTSSGQRVLFKRCTWLAGARALAVEVARILAVPARDLHPEDDADEAEILVDPT